MRVTAVDWNVEFNLKSLNVLSSGVVFSVAVAASRLANKVQPFVVVVSTAASLGTSHCHHHHKQTLHSPATIIRNLFAVVLLSHPHPLQCTIVPKSCSYKRRVSDPDLAIAYSCLRPRSSPSRIPPSSSRRPPGA